MRATEAQPQHPIGAVARRTGLSEHVLRAWERRYGAVEPARTEGGVRLYSDADIFRLRLLRRLTEAGGSIGQLATLPTGTLLELLQGDGDGDAPPPAPTPGAKVAARFATTILEAVEAMDGTRIHTTLMRAVVALVPDDFVHHLAIPLLVRVGDLWREGNVCPAQEHLLSVHLRHVLSWLMGEIRPAAGTPGLIATTPSGQTHELGAMLAGVIAADAGWHVTYLGPDLPAADIAKAAAITRPAVVALSAVFGPDRGRLEAELREIRELLDPSVLLVVGGKVAERIAPAGATYLPDLGALRAVLRSLHPEEESGASSSLLMEADG